MKFNVPSKILYGFVSAVSKVINSKNALTILNNFLFTLEGNNLTVKASDSENSLIGRLGVTESEGQGSFCLDARRIVELLKVLPDQGINFDVNEDTMEVKISHSTGCFTTMAINGDEYPIIKADEDDNQLSFVCNTEQLSRGIENVLFAVGSDPLRPQMMGVLWDIKPDRLILVSTDTRKLVKYTDTATQPGVEGSFILPLKAASVLRGVFSNESEIKVTATQRRVRFESTSFFFDCVLIKGAFPPYDRVIPANNPLEVTVDRMTLLNAVRLVNVSGDEGSGLVKFIFSTDNIELQTRDNSYGTSGRANVPCSYNGRNLTIGFSGQLIIEIFSTLTSPEVIVKLADLSRPAVCLPSEQPENSNIVILLMPMNIID